MACSRYSLSVRHSSFVPQIIPHDSMQVIRDSVTYTECPSSRRCSMRRTKSCSTRRREWSRRSSQRSSHTPFSFAASIQSYSHFSRIGVKLRLRDDTGDLLSPGLHHDTAVLPKELWQSKHRSAARCPESKSTITIGGMKSR